MNLFLTDILDRAQIRAPQPNFVEVQTFVIADTSVTTVFQHPNSEIYWPEILLGNTATLQAKMAIKPSVWSQVQAAVGFRVYVCSAGGAETLVLEHEIDARLASDRRWHDCEISLQPWAGQRVRLKFITEVPGGRTGMAWAGWGAPQVSQASLVRGTPLQPKAISPLAGKMAPLVLLVTCDALRRDHLSCYGNSPVNTPNLDQLATDGILLENSRSNSDTTLGSYAAMLAGKPPLTTGVLAEWGEFPTHQVALPQLFAAAGYRTVFAPSELEISDVSSRFSTLFGDHVPALGNPAQQSGLTTRRLIRYFEENPPTAESPVFAWLQLFEPHPPSLPEKTYVEAHYRGDPRSEANRYQSELLEKLHGVETVHALSLTWPDLKPPMPVAIFDRLRATAQELAHGGMGGPDLARHLTFMGSEAMLGMTETAFGNWLLRELQFTKDRQGDVSPALHNWLVAIKVRLNAINKDLLEHMSGVVDARYTTALYAASVASVDSAMAQLLTTLKSMGVYDEAVILFTSPHGEGIGPNDGGLMHHHYLGEEVLRTPAILKLPVSTHPQVKAVRSQTSLQTTEIAATLLQAASCPTASFFPASQQRLAAILKNEIDPLRAVASLGMQGMQSCLQRGEWKLVRKHDTWQASAKGEFSLENLSGASASAESHPELWQSMAEELERQIPAAAQDWSRHECQPPDHGLFEPSPEIANTNHEGQWQEKVRRLELQLKEQAKVQDQLHKQIATGTKRLREMKSVTEHLLNSRRWKLANAFRKQSGYAPLDKAVNKAQAWIEGNQASEQRISLGAERYPQWLQRQRIPLAEAWSRVAAVMAGETVPSFGLVVQISPQTRPEYFQKMRKSLEEQFYCNWQVWVVGTAPMGWPAPSDKFHFLSNWSEPPAGPSHWAAMGAEDELEPHALLVLAESIQQFPLANFFHTDEDEISDGGKVANPLFKPEWSPELLESMPYTGALAAASVEFLKQINSASPFLADSYDRALRSMEHPHFRLQRVPVPVYHRRIPSVMERKNQTTRDLHALRQALDRREELAQACLQPDGRTFRVQRLLLRQPRVTILIPTRNQARLLARCLHTLTALTQYQNYEVVILDNESTEEDALALLATCGHRVIPVPGPFNYAAMNNLGAAQTTGDMLLFLNNDTEVMEPNWLGAMLEHAQRPEIGAVGAKLLFPDNTVQHAGVVLGIQGRAAHAFAGSDPAASLARRQLLVTRNYTAVTAACLLMRREVFERLRGFDEERFKIAYNDVDLCVRACRLGLRVVYTPHAVLRHHECASRPRVDNPHEVALLQAHCFGKESGWIDPFYHPLLNQASPSFDLAY